MDHAQIGKLLGVISIHYPSFRVNEPELMIPEWYRIIGHLDYDEALARLDAWMEDPNNSKAPRAIDFKQAHTENRKKYYSDGIGPYLISIQGELVNEAGMRFAFPDNPNARFKYSRHGISYEDNSDHVAVPWAEINRRKWKAQQLKEAQAAGGDNNGEAI